LANNKIHGTIQCTEADLGTARSTAFEEINLRESTEKEFKILNSIAL